MAYDRRIVTIHSPADWQSVEDAHKACALMESLGVKSATWEIPAMKFDELFGGWHGGMKQIGNVRLIRS